MKYYKLVGREPVPVDDVLEWTKTLDDEQRRVALDTVNGYDVSTVFLGLDPSFGSGPPMLFETMVFPKGDLADLYCERYATWDEAIAGHAYAVELAKKGDFA